MEDNIIVVFPGLSRYDKIDKFTLECQNIRKRAVLISLTKTKTKMVVNGNTCTSLTKTKIETKILAKTEKKH